MRKMEFSKMSKCLWALRFEVLGVILLIIATGLTISSGNGLGIVALFAAGVIFCLFNKFCSYVCSSKQPPCPVCDVSHSYHSEESIQIQEKEENEAKQSMDNEGGNQTNRER
ncbi:TPA: hypothetical protein RJD57_000283 [Legionella pneumophila]|nr:hypothetical protein DI137_15425 [Legionella pneumophila]HAT7755516.1 hypothetical protein [Legionella pneumophila]HAT7811585.1 hypothetical protein [Legionella pneumophila]HAT8351541.1 hypothetical protein [Legionella pneumophila]HAT8568210.1 hypothetical protein [Legionella pneumophila]